MHLTRSRFLLGSHNGLVQIPQTLYIRCCLYPTTRARAHARTDRLPMWQKKAGMQEGPFSAAREQSWQAARQYCVRACVRGLKEGCHKGGEGSDHCCLLSVKSARISGPFMQPRWRPVRCLPNVPGHCLATIPLFVC